MVLVYRPTSAQSSSLHFDNLFQSVLLAGDLSCCNPSWVTNSKHSCPTGESLFNSFTENKLLVLNTGFSTHFDSTNPANIFSSCLDLAYVSLHFYLIYSWSNKKDTYSFDHFPISLSLDIPTYLCTTKFHHPNYLKISSKD